MNCNYIVQAGILLFWVKKYYGGMNSRSGKSKSSRPPQESSYILCTGVVLREMRSRAHVNDSKIIPTYYFHILQVGGWSSTVGVRRLERQQHPSLTVLRDPLSGTQMSEAGPSGQHLSCVRKLSHYPKYTGEFQNTSLAASLNFCKKLWILLVDFKFEL